MVTNEVHCVPESGNDVSTLFPRKIFAAGRPDGTCNLRGEHGHIIGALSGNPQGERSLGYHDQGLWLPVLAFADNIWLFAKTPNELEQMFRAWIAVTQKQMNVLGPLHTNSLTKW